MRTTFATVLFAAGAQALTWTDVTDFVKKLDVPALMQNYLDVDIKQHPAWDFHVTTRADTRAKIEKNPWKPKPLTHQQRERITQAHHSLLATRERLGLPRLNTSGHPQVGQDFASLNSLSGFTLNVLAGMSYNGNRNNRCYRAFEGAVIAIDT
jgi:hypothetical protein